MAMELAMVAAAEGDCELVADLASERAALDEAKVVGVGGLPATDQTGMGGDKFDVLAVTRAARFGEC